MFVAFVKLKRRALRNARLYNAEKVKEKEQNIQADATPNVRLNKDLTQRGDAVLAREGISTTHAVRMLYQYLDQNQEAPT